MTSLLSGAGLAEIEIDLVGFVLPIADFDEFWNGMVENAVRIRAVVHGQPEEISWQIREGVAKRLEPYRTDLGLEIPVSATLASGTKPK
jgi:hypothetical protein